MHIIPWGVYNRVPKEAMKANSVLEIPIWKVAAVLPPSCSAPLLTETFMHAQCLKTSGLTILGTSENYHSTNKIVIIKTLKQ